jgi:hypothetical protein
MDISIRYIVKVSNKLTHISFQVVLLNELTQYHIRISCHLHLSSNRHFNVLDNLNFYFRNKKSQLPAVFLKADTNSNEFNQIKGEPVLKDISRTQVEIQVSLISFSKLQNRLPIILKHQTMKR